MRIVRWFVFASSFALLLLLSGHLSVSAQSDDVAQLDAFITKAMQTYGVPGAAVAVVRDGQVVLTKGYGVRDATKPGAVDENTVFQLASVTKTLTGAAAGTVVDEGKLDWDTPIFNYLPEFVGYDPYMTRYLTLRDLLAMRTGWEEFTGDQIDSFGYDRAEILHRLRYFKPKYSLREVAQYSNPGYFVAGEVMGRAAGTSWNEVVESHLFKPLEMTRSRTVVGPLQDPNVSANHAVIDGKLQVVEQSILNTTGAASSGMSTAADMSHLLLMFLNEGKYKDQPILKPATLKDIFERSMVSALSFSELPPISEATGFYYGMGVGTYDYADTRIMAKGGALAGIRTIIVMLPEKKSGIFIAANLNLTVFPEAVRAYFIHQVLGMDPMINQAEILAVNEQMKQFLVTPKPPASPVPFNGTLQSLVGVYENDYYGRCEIKLNGEALGVECGPAKYPATLTHWNYGAFMMKFPGATQTPIVTTFTIGADGTAESFTTEAFGVFTRVEQ